MAYLLDLNISLTYRTFRFILKYSFDALNLSYYQNFEGL